MNAFSIGTYALPLLAQVTKMASSSSQPAADPPGWAKIATSPILPLAVGMLVLFMFMNRSKKKQEGTRELMLKQLKRGDRVQTIGGILGSVLRVEDSRVEVKVDESSNAKIWFARTAIHKVIEDDAKADVK